MGVVGGGFVVVAGVVVAVGVVVRGERGIHILLGSISETGPDTERTYNTSVWINENGEVLTTYRKIHLFDIDIPGSESHQESARIAPGDRTVCVETNLGIFGMSICYQLRERIIGLQVILLLIYN